MATVSPRLSRSERSLRDLLIQLSHLMRRVDVSQPRNDLACRALWVESSSAVDSVRVLPMLSMACDTASCSTREGFPSSAATVIPILQFCSCPRTIRQLVVEGRRCLVGRPAETPQGGISRVCVKASCSVGAASTPLSPGSLRPRDPGGDWHTFRSQWPPPRVCIGPKQQFLGTSLLCLAHVCCMGMGLPLKRLQRAGSLAPEPHALYRTLAPASRNVRAKVRSVVSPSFQPP